MTKLQREKLKSFLQWLVEVSDFYVESPNEDPNIERINYEDCIKEYEEYLKENKS